MEQRRAFGTRLAGALTFAFALMLVLGLAGPIQADITSINPAAVTVTGGDSKTVTVALSGDDTCLGATPSSSLLVVTISPQCNTGPGPWTATATITPDYDTPGGSYSVTFVETPQSDDGTSDSDVLAVTVIEAPPTTTTTTQPEGTTTTTQPEGTTTTTSSTTSTTTSPTTTTTAPTTTTTTTGAPAESTLPPTTVEPTTTTTLESSPGDSGGVPPSTAPPDPVEARDADYQPQPAGEPVGPDHDHTGGTTLAEVPAPSLSPLVAALGPSLQPEPADQPSRAFSLRRLAEAIPRTLRDLVVSPFVIAGVILRAIRDTGAATIWPLVIVIPLIIDWRAMRRRLRVPARLRTS